MMRRLALDAVLRLHIQLICHLVAIVGKEVVIKRLTVACNTTPDGGGVCRENGSYSGNMLMYVQGTQTCHPFVGLIDNTLALIQEEIVVAFNHTSSSIGEH